MKTAIGAALGMVLAHGFGVADTGFLDRAVTLGTVTYPYQVYVPAETFGINLPAPTKH